MTTTAERRRARAILAHPEDVHCVLFHLLVLAGYALAFWLWLHPGQAGLADGWDRAAFVLCAGLLLGWVSGIDVGVNFHNHTHRRIFTRSWMNRWFGRLWTFSGGWPSFYWNHAHVVVHHAGLLDEDDWTLPRRRADGSFESLYAYVLLHWPWRYAVHLWRDFRGGRGGRRVGRKALIELALFLPLWSIPFWIDPSMGLFLWLFPQWVGNAITMGSGMYVQHAGCRAKSAQEPCGHSNTFLSPLFNLTMFNIGYHVEHHDNPHVHWSELPRFHRERRAELVRGGAHVVPYGYYRAASLCSRLPDPARGVARFRADQAAGYGPPPSWAGEEAPAARDALRAPREAAGPLAAVEAALERAD